MHHISITNVTLLEIVLIQVLRQTVVSHLEFLSLKGGCRGLPESTHVKKQHCWKSHATAQNVLVQVLRQTVVSHLEFLSLKGGCRGLSESTHFKNKHCWKSHATAQIVLVQVLRQTVVSHLMSHCSAI